MIECVRWTPAIHLAHEKRWPFISSVHLFFDKWRECLVSSTQVSVNWSVSQLVVGCIQSVVFSSKFILGGMCQEYPAVSACRLLVNCRTLVQYPICVPTTVLSLIAWNVIYSVLTTYFRQPHMCCISRFCTSVDSILIILLVKTLQPSFPCFSRCKPLL